MATLAQGRKVLDILDGFPTETVQQVLEDGSLTKLLRGGHIDDVIYFNVTSDGTTGLEWIERLEGKGFRLDDYAKDILRSSNFRPTSGVVTKIAILRSSAFDYGDQITQKIYAEADKRRLMKPNAEVACLIRESFSNEAIQAMGLCWIPVMHEPIKDSGGVPRLLSVDSDNGRCLSAYRVRSSGAWNLHNGFAFAVSQV